MRVNTGISKHLWSERSLSPVSKLVGLICRHITIVVEEVCIGKLRETQKSRGSMSIKKIQYVNVEISLQPLCIHLSSMHNFNNTFVFHDSLQLWDFSPNGKDINNKISMPRWNLYEAGQSLVTFVWVLHVYCNLRLFA